MIAHDSINVNLTYEVLNEIAQGGMGFVYEAVQRGSDGFTKKVAIKSLLDTLRNDKEYVELFVHEAKLVSKLTHENIVQVYQLIHTPKALYYIMEYVNGFSLRDLIDSMRGQTLPFHLSTYIVIKVAYALDFAHNYVSDDGKIQNILHRDIRPNNILLSKRGAIKVSDFGLAQEVNRSKYDCIGTVGYVAPEVVNDMNHSIRSEIYSLGLILFELLSGKNGRSLGINDALFEAKKGIINWNLISSDVPSGFIKVLEKSLAFNPKDRYESMAKMAEALELVVYANGYKKIRYEFREFLQTKVLAF